jgi:membrane-associated phospholipid phosphatase
VSFVARFLQQAVHAGCHNLPRPHQISFIGMDWLQSAAGLPAGNPRQPFPVRRERPNRALVRRYHAHVARLGNAWDSFPSGHAMHLSAIAASARRLVPRRWRPMLTGGLAALAATRVMLLTHYPSDVAAGWGSAS